MGWAIEGKDQKQNGGLLCFLGAKGLFFNSLIVGLVLLTPRVCHGLGPDPRQTPGSASEARRQSPDETCSRQVWGRAGLSDPVLRKGPGNRPVRPLNWAGFYSRWAVSAFGWEEEGRRKGLKLRSLLRQKSLSLETERGREKQQQV